MRRLTVAAALIALLAAPTLAQQDDTRAVLDSPAGAVSGSSSLVLLSMTLDRGTVDPVTGQDTGCDDRFVTVWQGENGQRFNAFTHDQLDGGTCDDAAKAIFRALNTADFSGAQTFLDRVTAWALGRIAQHPPTQPLPAGTVQ